MAIARCLATLSVRSAPGRQRGESAVRTAPHAIDPNCTSRRSRGEATAQCFGLAVSSMHDWTIVAGLRRRRRAGRDYCFDWQEPGASACPGERLRLVKPSLAGMKAMQVVFASIQQPKLFPCGQLWHTTRVQYGTCGGDRIADFRSARSIFLT